MNPENFRIGNFVETPDGIQPIIEISQHAVYTADFKSTWAEIKAIKLHDGWLQMFGIKTGEKLFKNKSGTIGIIHPNPLGFKFYLHSRFGLVYLDSIDKVHQLQNLYFALTGEELTLKEEVKP